MIKILHCADLHLDSPIVVSDIRQSEMRRNELRAAFTSLIMSAKMNEVDFLLIAGDLFDGEYVSKDTIALLCHEFASIPECRIIISPGNHDPFSPSSYYRRGEFPSNVYIFDSPEVTSFDFPEINTTVYGYAFTSDKLEICPLEGFKVADDTRINILTAHGDYNVTKSDYCPIPADVPEACGFDYIALGHRHSYTEPFRVGRGYAAYSGCLEGRGFDECGLKGAIMAAAEKKGEFTFASKFTKYCKKQYHIEAVDVSGSQSNVAVAEKIADFIDKNHYGEDTALRLLLQGQTEEGFVISKEFLRERFPRLFMLDIVDKTVPCFDLSKLAADLTLRGEFYRSFAPMLESEDADERETAAAALKCGLAVLAGNDFCEI